MAKSLMPKSKAKTAYGLLSEIAKLALAEPRRIRMARWITDTADLPEDAVPACGTVGCIGGWAIVLRGRRDERRLAQANGFGYDAEQRAANILGINLQQSYRLFNSDVRGVPGGAVHARNVVARIRRFQKRHAAQLKAKHV